uniref:Uncharacterized protein n=1 Tax=Salix viminalis TaxID=40686 RepID=A0A6N2L9C8_SALVM
MKCYKGHPDLIPQQRGEGMADRSPDLPGFPEGVSLWNRYCGPPDLRISRFIRALVEAALVNSGTKYRGGLRRRGVVRFGADDMGEKERGVSGADKKRERCNTRTSQEVTHPSTTLAQARLTAEF